MRPAFRRWAVPALAAAAVLAAAAPPPVRAAVSEDVRSLPLRRAVRTPAGAATGTAWITVAEDSSLASACRPDFADLRLVNGDGESVPFAVLPPMRRDLLLEPVGVFPLRWSAASDGLYEAAVDLGPAAPESLRVTLAVDRGSRVFEFRGGVSPGGLASLTWRPSAPAGPRPGRPGARAPRAPVIPAGEGKVFRYDLESGGRVLQLQFRSASIRDLPDSVRVEARRSRRVFTETAAFRIASSGFDGRLWRAVLELEGPPRAVAAVLWAPEETASRRPVQVEARRPDGGWRFVADGTETGRVEDFTPGLEGRTGLAFDPVRTTAIRITVTGTDPPNAPLAPDRVVVVPERWAVPPEEAAGELWVAFGDRYLGAQDWYLEEDAARAPRYLAAALGPAEPSPWYSPPGFGLDWLRRRPAALTVLMVAVLAVVALVAFRRRPGAQG